MLAHWVPLPAPGPPSTNTTRGLATDMILLAEYSSRPLFGKDNNTRNMHAYSLTPSAPPLPAAYPFHGNVHADL